MYPQDQLSELRRRSIKNVGILISSLVLQKVPDEVEIFTVLRYKTPRH